LLGFEDILDAGVNNSWYDANNVLEGYALIFIFHLTASHLPSSDLQFHRYRLRSITGWIIATEANPVPTRTRFFHTGYLILSEQNQNIMGPLISKCIMKHSPLSLYLKFFAYLKVIVLPEVFAKVKQEYAPTDRPIFELVPPAFNDCADILYTNIGQPAVQSNTFWDVYCQLLQQFRIEEHVVCIAPILMTHCNAVHALELEEEMPLLPNLKELQNGANVVRPLHAKYIGGMVNNPPVSGLRPGINIEVEESDSEVGDNHGAIADPQYAEFTSDDDDEDREEDF
jgi:hypothetical protein